MTGKNNTAKIISPHCACVYLMMRLVELQEAKYGTFMYFNERSSFDTLHYTHAFFLKIDQNIFAIRHSFFAYKSVLNLLGLTNNNPGHCDKQIFPRGTRP